MKRPKPKPPAQIAPSAEELRAMIQANAEEAASFFNRITRELQPPDMRLVWTKPEEIRGAARRIQTYARMAESFADRMDYLLGKGDNKQ